MTDSGAEFWDEKYRLRQSVWTGEPNDTLVDAVRGRVLGRALEVGSGDGADAIWLSERGWDVTATDISAVAIEKARPFDMTGRVTWLQADLLTWAPDASAYDLVAAHFVHFASADRSRVFTRLAAAVRADGMLLIVAHHPSDLQTTAGRWPMPDFYFTADEIVALLDPSKWAIIEADSRPRDAVDPAGSAIVVHDTVLRAIRLS